MKKIKILSIDGGGIRGIMPGTILTYIEEQLQEKTGEPNVKIGEYFDFIAGTSTGGILSLVYLCPDKNGGFKFSAKQALDIYLDRGDEIFDVTLGKKIKSIGGILDEKYHEFELEQALKDYLNEVKLSQALKPCLITSYDIRNRKAHFFTSADAKEEIYDYHMKDVARATSAAPTYFEPSKVKSLYGTPHYLIDGGVFANNPALCAYAEARTLDFSKLLSDTEKPNKPTANEMFILSIGTGAEKEPYYYKEFKDAGAVKWIKPLIDIMMSGNSETVDYQLKQIYQTLSIDDCKDYYRIQPDIITANNQMDDASLPNLKALHHDGKTSIENMKQQIDEIVDKLIQYH
ncbi:patatin-like phospholipase family protein [Mesonia maritima]|uniref:Patatin-like phospholipase/acyl hydrolase n=1 Tax=Mesonia maritima TaxID=1793873 RepID=A0ABU1K4W1_9FLAO|nr:patatin-like phospholipase family protein [Mesonia maritima]MDR6300653.1 patatin-like phospholipase/acyl hydrolase [Mesonia maritima]